VVEGPNHKVWEENPKTVKNVKNIVIQVQKSKKHHRSKDKEEKPIIDTPISVIEVQSCH
jgi:hypothetical protein